MRCFEFWRCNRRNCSRCGAEVRREEERARQLEEFLRELKRRPARKPEPPDDPRLN